MKTYKFKLYKTKKQKHLHRKVALAGIVYNHFIALHKRYYRMFGKYPNKYKLKRHLTKIKKHTTNKDWSSLGSQALQDIVFRIDFGYQKFFKKENKAPPSFRKLKKFRSFTLTQAGWGMVDKNTIRIDKHNYRYFNSQEIEGNPKLVHIKRDKLGDFYIFVVTDFEEKAPKYNTASDKSVGIDFGLKTFLHCSDGKKIESPQFFKQNRNAIVQANKVLSRKKKGSKAKKKAIKNLARAHKKCTNQRLDWQRKLAKEICKENAYIFIEDLNLDGMKRLWGRKVSDLAFHQFALFLKQEAKKTGAVLHKIDRWTKTTGKCFNCDQEQRLTLGDRVWICDSCETKHDRDHSASIAIKNSGVSELEVDLVRQSNSAKVV